MIKKYKRRHKYCIGAQISVVYCQKSLIHCQGAGLNLILAICGMKLLLGEVVFLTWVMRNR